jgi:hypothetical protein
MKIYLDKGKRQKAKGKRQKAKGKRQKLNDLSAVNKQAVLILM